jgi:hypothetical protein
MREHIHQTLNDDADQMMSSSDKKWLFCIADMFHIAVFVVHFQLSSHTNGSKSHCHQPQLFEMIDMTRSENFVANIS